MTTSMVEVKLAGLSVIVCGPTHVQNTMQSTGWAGVTINSVRDARGA
jgi:hypothetical protein